MGEATGIVALLGTLNQVFTTLLGNVGTLTAWIIESGHELALIPVGVVLGYTAIKAFKMIL